MKPSKRVLGKGLKAILGDSAHTPMQHTSVLAVKDIAVNPYQPRSQFDKVALDELALSIKQHGIIQPITVRKNQDGLYQLISGERRLQACRLLNQSTIPAYVRDADDSNMLEMALIENIQRTDLNAIEVSLAYQRLIAECQLTQEALAMRVGKERATVTNYLRLLKLPPNIQAALRDNKITMGHARALLAVNNPEEQIAMLNNILTNKLSVRDVEKYVSKKNTKTTPKKHKNENKIVYKTLENKLKTHFSTRVNIQTKGKKGGAINIPFYSDDDLERLMELLGI